MLRQKQYYVCEKCGNVLTVKRLCLRPFTIVLCCRDLFQLPNLTRTHYCLLNQPASFQLSCWGSAHVKIIHCENHSINLDHYIPLCLPYLHALGF